jgi:hypothetical protein
MLEDYLGGTDGPSHSTVKQSFKKWFVYIGSMRHTSSFRTQFVDYIF